MNARCTGRAARLPKGKPRMLAFLEMDKLILWGYTSYFCKKYDVGAAKALLDLLGNLAQALGRYVGGDARALVGRAGIFRPVDGLIFF